MSGLGDGSFSEGYNSHRSPESFSSNSEARLGSALRMRDQIVGSPYRSDPAHDYHMNPDLLPSEARWNPGSIDAESIRQHCQAMTGGGFWCAYTPEEAAERLARTKKMLRWAGIALVSAGVIYTSFQAAAKWTTSKVSHSFSKDVSSMEFTRDDSVLKAVEAAGPEGVYDKLAGLSFAEIDKLQKGQALGLRMKGAAEGVEFMFSPLPYELLAERGRVKDHSWAALGLTDEAKRKECVRYLLVQAKRKDKSLDIPTDEGSVYPVSFTVAVVELDKPLVLDQAKASIGMSKEMQKQLADAKKPGKFKIPSSKRFFLPFFDDYYGVTSKQYGILCPGDKQAFRMGFVRLMERVGDYVDGCIVANKRNAARETVVGGTLFADKYATAGYGSDPLKKHRAVEAVSYEVVGDAKAGAEAKAQGEALRPGSAEAKKAGVGTIGQVKEAARHGK